MDLMNETEWINEDVEHPKEFWEELPKPILWRLLVMPIKPKEVSKGGIVIPTAAQDAQGHLNYIGKIVAMGALAFKSEKYEGETGFPKLGDYVLYSRYAGQQMKYRGTKLLIVNDDEILGRVPNPEALQVHI